MRRFVTIAIVSIYAFVTNVDTAPAYYTDSPCIRFCITVSLLNIICGKTRGPSYTVSSTENHKPFIEVRNSTYHGSGPREEARAMCSVRTQEVNATANATITRRLHGVVTSRELHTAVQRLEVIIFGQMQQLWQSLDALRVQIAGESRANYPDRRTLTFRYKPGTQ